MTNGAARNGEKRVNDLKPYNAPILRIADDVALMADTAQFVICHLSSVILLGA
jgi:hypothetical protein